MTDSKPCGDCSHDLDRHSAQEGMCLDCECHGWSAEATRDWKIDSGVIVERMEGYRWVEVIRFGEAYIRQISDIPDRGQCFELRIPAIHPRTHKWTDEDGDRNYVRKEMECGRLDIHRGWPTVVGYIQDEDTGSYHKERWSLYEEDKT